MNKEINLLLKTNFHHQFKMASSGLQEMFFLLMALLLCCVLDYGFWNGKHNSISYMWHVILTRVLVKGQIVDTRDDVRALYTSVPVEKTINQKQIITRHRTSIMNLHIITPTSYIYYSSVSIIHISSSQERFMNIWGFHVISN